MEPPFQIRNRLRSADMEMEPPFLIRNRLRIRIWNLSFKFGTDWNLPFQLLTVHICSIFLLSNNRQDCPKNASLKILGETEKNDRNYIYFYLLHSNFFRITNPMIRNHIKKFEIMSIGLQHWGRRGEGTEGSRKYSIVFFNVLQK
jgi:hypothetical protein